jgi:type II secretory pathway pseudopilin PulG
MAPRIAEERGETLIELLLTIVIMGITVVAVVGGLLAAIRMSDIHRRQATAGAAARDYVENVDRFVAGTGYVGCAGSSAYAPATVGFSAPAGFTAAVVSVRFWTGTAWTSSCSSDQGLQQLTVQVQSADGRATEQAVVVLRKPCGQGATC